MKVSLDKFEMYYLLESCFRGSHLRSNTILRFVDEWYDMLCDGEKACLYEWVLRDIYDGEFKPTSRLCGADEIFMAAYNPENRYSVTTFYDGETKVVNAFLIDGKYFVKSKRFIAPEYITKIEKI